MSQKGGSEVEIPGWHGGCPMFTDVRESHAKVTSRGLLPGLRTKVPFISQHRTVRSAATLAADFIFTGATRKPNPPSAIMTDLLDPRILY